MSEIVKASGAARRRNTTIAAALAASARHKLSGIADGIILCGCGAWFADPDLFNEHRADLLAAELAAYKPRRRNVDRHLLEQVAEVYTAAAPGRRQAAVGALLGVSSQSAGTYVSRARKLGVMPESGCADDEICRSDHLH